MKAHILKRLVKNDAATQKAVYYLHADRLMSIVLRYVPTVAEAEDVLQESFVKIFEKIKQFDPARGKFESWSARIAINFALMYLRKKRKLEFYEEDLHAHYLETKNSAESKLESEDLLKLLNELDEKYAVVFKLKVIDGYKHKEIADLLGINIEASKTIYSRARKKLIQLIQTRDHNLFISKQSLL